MSETKRQVASDERAKAVIVGVQLPNVDDASFQASLDELARLADTLGLDVIGRLTQRRQRLDAGAVIGEGKLKELGALTGGKGEVETRARRIKQKKFTRDDDSSEGLSKESSQESSRESSRESEKGEEQREGEGSETAGVVLVDHDLTPSQARNLERATDAEVLDRSSVILSIFQRHAHTREAKLQVEIARLKYLAPRLREVGGKGDRVRGGIGGKGAGESAVELDRRKIRDRIAELKEELAAIEKESGTRRRRRATEPTVALVGYTNAGKSSLFRALTGTDVYVADQLFATLDTTVRALSPETVPRILASDTVGFIRDLPHDLVASFRSTLEEAGEAQLVVHVVDAADPALESQRAVTRAVLADLDVPGEGQSVLLVLNKADLVDDIGRAALRARHPDAFLGSAKSPADVAALRALLVAHFERDMIEEEVFVPWAEAKRAVGIRAALRVLGERHDESGTWLRVKGTREAITALER